MSGIFESMGIDSGIVIIILLILTIILLINVVSSNMRPAVWNESTRCL